MAIVGGILAPLGLWWFAWYETTLACYRNLPILQDLQPIDSLGCAHPRRHSLRCGNSADSAMSNNLSDGHLHHLLCQCVFGHSSPAIRGWRRVSFAQPVTVQHPRRPMGHERLCMFVHRLHAYPYSILGALRLVARQGAIADFISWLAILARRRDTAGGSEASLVMDTRGQMRHGRRRCQEVRRIPLKQRRRPAERTSSHLR